MLQRTLLGLALLLVAWFGLLGLISAFASDETKITWLLEDMEAGYNRGNVRDTTGSLSVDWSHAEHPVSRRGLERGLAAEFFQNRSPRTKKLTSRVVFDWDSLELELGKGTAAFELELQFERARGEEWTSAWKARIRGELIDTHSGWSIQKTSHVDIDGTLLSR